MCLNCNVDCIALMFQLRTALQVVYVCHFQENKSGNSTQVKNTKVLLKTKTKTHTAVFNFIEMPLKIARQKPTYCLSSCCRRRALFCLR